jgi:hypothetical protein
MPSIRTPPTSARLLDIPVTEPSPSTKLIPHSGGFKYTHEDDVYFVQYVLWAFSQDVESSKLAVCQALSAKVSSEMQ